MAFFLASLLLTVLQAEPAQEAGGESGPPAVQLQSSAVLRMTPGSALGSLEREMITLYRDLRPALVKVALSIPLGLDEDGEPEIHHLMVSGVVLDRDGVFVAPGLTHGTDDPVRVTRFDGEVFLARPVAQDKEFGLTLFRAPELGVPPPPLGWPSALRVGMITVTLGNAYDLDGTLDGGVVAGPHRRGGGGSRPFSA
ncbi:MAG: serine protease, partial [Planctomycetes bacterium]|nr:serine protease [Planctomycetota bacterium]